MSNKGNLFLRYSKNIFLTDLQEKKILKLLDIKNAEKCKEIRTTLKEQSGNTNSYAPIKKWIKSERPREMLLKEGSDKLSLSKLFAIILSTGSIGKSAEDLARKLLNKFKTLRNLNAVSIKKFAR